MKNYVIRIFFSGHLVILKDYFFRKIPEWQAIYLVFQLSQNFPPYVKSILSDLEAIHKLVWDQVWLFVGFLSDQTD